MLLAELAEASGTSAASIKFYRREGLLPPGERITTTRQEYGPRHLERLQLIQVLRELVDAPIGRILRLTAILDDPEQGLLPALAEAQRITLGVDADPCADGEGTDRAPEHPSIAPLLAHLGWPDVPSAPRQALDSLLHSLDEWGAPSGPEVLIGYAEPMQKIARADVAWMRRLPEPRTGAPDSPGPAPAAGSPDAPGPSDDVMVMRAVAGTVAYDRLVQLLRALGHASLSVLEDRLPRP